MNEYTVLNLEVSIQKVFDRVLNLTTPDNRWKPPLVVESPQWVPHGRNRTVFWTTTVSIFGTSGRRICVLRPNSDGNGVYMIYLSGETDPDIDLIRAYFHIVSEVKIPREATGSEIAFDEIEANFKY